MLRQILRWQFPVLVILAGCDSPLTPRQPADSELNDSLPALPVAPAPVRSGDLLYFGSSGLWGDTTTPPRVSISVMARNASMAPVSLADLCVIQLSARLEGGTKEWRTEKATVCSESPGLKEIAAGGKVYIHSAGNFDFPPVRTILGDSLPEGRYELFALVRAGANLVNVPAGSVGLSRDARPPLLDANALSYNAATVVESVAPRELVTRVVATNRSGRYVYIEYGACSLRIRAYRTPERSGTPVWRSERRKPPLPNTVYACPAYLATKLVSPGETYSAGEFTERIPLHEVLGDSLPSGRYYFTAELNFLNSGNKPVALSAGSADLIAGNAPMPQERLVAGVRFHAEVLPAADNRYTLNLAATNVRQDSVIVTGNLGVTCPSQLAGYRTTAQRDRWFMWATSDWYQTSCVLRISPTWLRPGETRTFSGLIDKLPAQTGTGRYYLALFLWLDIEPPLPDTRNAWQSITLSAGEVIF